MNSSFITSRQGLLLSYFSNFPPFSATRIRFTAGATLTGFFCFVCAGPSYKNNSSLAVFFSIAAYGILNAPTVIEMCCPLVDKGYYLGIWVFICLSLKI